MKIGKPADVQPTDALARSGPVAPSGARPGSVSGQGDVAPAASVDQVKLSPTSRQLVNDSGSTDELVRADKVNEVRTALNEGRFHVDAQAVADKMIAQAAELLEILSTPK